VLLLSIAVIDDLIAIAIIALVFTADLALVWLAGGLLAGGLYWLAFRQRLDRAWLLWALGVIAWICIHASGVHATVVGILLGVLTPVHTRAGEEESPAERLEHRVHPLSAGLAVPVFALAAAGISLGALGEAFGDAVAIGVFTGLLVGKVGGVLGGAWLAVRLRLGTLPSEVGWGDVLPVAVLAAIGYTVSLLIAQLALPDTASQERSAAAVLAAAVVASIAAIALLRRRARGEPYS
jgi:NhaA family Na+:H+ antiporter